MMYLVHIAAYLGLLVTASGFVGMHFAVREKSAYLRIAALILVIGGILGLLCILYYSFTYWQQGFFATPAPIHSMGRVPPMQ